MNIELTMETLRSLLTEAGRLGGYQALADAGVTTGEITQSEAFARFGRRWVEAQIADGKLTPSRVGAGKNGAKRYSLANIQAIRASETIKAELIRTTL